MICSRQGSSRIGSRSWRRARSSSPRTCRRKPCGKPPAAALDWTEALARSAQARLGRGENGILNDLTGEFERTLIRVALAHTGGRKIEAANLLGWGRNTLTRKIQELGMEAGGEE